MASIDEPHESLAGRQNCDKALQTLDGIITGIACDEQINPAEIAELQRWLMDTEVLRTRHPASPAPPSSLIAIFLNKT